MIIDQLPNLASVQETDEIPVERGTTTYKSTLQKLKDLVASLLTKSDVGLENVDNVRQYSAENPPNESGAGYCKMPDGTLIQWGFVINTDVGYTGVTFPVAFVNDNFIFSASPRYSPAYPVIDYRTVSQKASNAGGMVNFKTLTSTASYTTPAIADWFAIGRWK